jgi:hypothetical protein
LNKFVLKWASCPTFVVLLALASTSQALAARPKPYKAPVATQKADEVPAATARRAAQVNATYTSAEPGCLTARRKLWTDDGWIVRRVTSCR